NLASPWNVIYPKTYLDKDPNYFKTNVMGSGPFKFKAYTRGATFEGVRNPDYFVKDRPYLDGYKFFISPETSVRAAAIRSGRAYIEFRDLSNAEVEAIKKQLGDKIVVQTTPMTGQFGIAINNAAKPFNDVQNTGNFELIIAPTVEFMDDPDQFLGRYVTGSTQNWGRYSDPRLDDLFSRQARTLEPAERQKLVNELQKVVLENAYYMPGL